MKGANTSGVHCTLRIFKILSYSTVCLVSSTLSLTSVHRYCDVFPWSSYCQLSYCVCVCICVCVCWRLVFYCFIPAPKRLGVNSWDYCCLCLNLDCVSEQDETRGGVDARETLDWRMRYVIYLHSSWSASQLCFCDNKLARNDQNHIYIYTQVDLYTQTVEHAAKPRPLFFQTYKNIAIYFLSSTSDNLLFKG